MSCPNDSNRQAGKGINDAEIERMLKAHQTDPQFECAAKYKGPLNWPMFAAWKTIVRNEARKRGLI